MFFNIVLQNIGIGISVILSTRVHVTCSKFQLTVVKHFQKSVLIFSAV